jgi:hypothetical protein
MNKKISKQLINNERYSIQFFTTRGERSDVKHEENVNSVIILILQRIIEKKILLF